MPARTEKKQHKPQHPRGQSLVEFALLAPILLLLILGAMDFARMFSIKVTLTNAAREGANYLSRHPEQYPQNPEEDPDKLNNTIAVIDSEAVDITGIQKFISCSNDCETGDTVTVTLIREVDLIFGGFLQTFGLSGSAIELSSTVEMMVQ
jgi:Flp pilus assembly protein TadG